MRTAAVARSLVETWRDQSEVGPNLRPRIDKMAVSDVNKLVDNISNAIATQPDPQAGAINAVAELEKVVNFEPPISEPTPLGPGPTSTAISRAEEVRQRALHFAALVIQGQNYVDVLRGHSGLDFRFVENKKQLIDSVEHHKAWSFEGG